MISILNLLISYLIISTTGGGRDAALWVGTIIAFVVIMVAAIFLRYRAIYLEFRGR